MQQSVGYILIRRFEGFGIVLYSVKWYLQKVIPEEEVLKQADSLVREFIVKPGSITHQVFYRLPAKTFE